MSKSKRKLPKERNPVAVSAIMKKGGVHQKSYKARRRDLKVELKKNPKDYSENLS